MAKRRRPPKLQRKPDVLQLRPSAGTDLCAAKRFLRQHGVPDRQIKKAGHENIVFEIPLPADRDERIRLTRRARSFGYAI